MNLRVLRYLLRMLAGVLAATTATAMATEAWMSTTHEVVKLLQSPANEARGQELFAQCAECHIAGTQTLPKGWVPEILGQHPRYLAKELIDFSRGVRWDVRMQPIAREHARLGGQDIVDVVTYVSRQAPDRRGAGVPDLQTSVEPSRTYYRNSCSGCHGPAGAGEDTVFVPRIAGQDYNYLLRQMHDVVDGRRPNMRSQHLKLLVVLNVQQLDNLAAYLSQLAMSETH